MAKRDDPNRRLTKRQQGEVSKWLPDAYNMAFARLNGIDLSATEYERRKTICEDALIDAVIDYDATKGASFSTFLYRRIQWRILDAGKVRRSKVAQAKCFTDILAE